MKTITLAVCPGCDRALRLHEFRKWWGSKRLLRTLCISCEPEKALEDMTPWERERAVDNQRPYATPMRVARLNEAEVQAERRRRSTGATRRHSQARTQAWAPVLRVLRAERAWCQKNLLSPASPAWAAFFSAYETALADALRKAMARKAGTRSTTEVPEAHTFLYPETYRNLRALYGQCRPMPGRRLYRDPLCLAWSEAQA
jgi:hypothetical protein